VKIRNFVHKGLKRLYEEDKAKGVPPDTVDKLRKMPAYLDDIDSPEELRALTAWNAHTLIGDRKGKLSLSDAGSYDIAQTRKRENKSASNGSIPLPSFTVPLA
jgi:proteic killer suppression protein